MDACVLTETCIFFNGKMANMPSMAGMYRKKYCSGDFTSCARYCVFVAVGRDNVPFTLYPNEAEKIAAIIKNIERAGKG